MEAITLAALSKKLLDLVRNARAGNVSAVLTQLVACLIGFVAAWLVGQSDLTSLHTIGGVDLATANTATLALVGIGFGLGSGLVSDAIKAVDNTQTTAVPSLLTGETTLLVPVVQPLRDLGGAVPRARKAAKK